MEVTSLLQDTQLDLTTAGHVLFLVDLVIRRLLALSRPNG